MFYGRFMATTKKKPLVATQKLNRKALKHKMQKTTKQVTQEEKKKRN